MGWVKETKKEGEPPSTSNSGQEEGSEPSRAEAMKGELPNRDVRDSVLARPVVRQWGSRDREPDFSGLCPLILLLVPPLTTPNRKPKHKEPNDVVCRGQRIRAQSRHRWKINPQDKQQITSKQKMFEMTTVEHGSKSCLGMGLAWGCRPWVYNGSYLCWPFIISWGAQPSTYKWEWFGWPRSGGNFRQVGWKHNGGKEIDTGKVSVKDNAM